MDQLEKQIIKEILAGRTERFDYIARTYGRRVFALIVRIIPCREDAEELTQDTMVKVYASLDRFRADSSLSTWIYRIAYTTALTHARRNRPPKVAVGRERAARSGRRSRRRTARFTARHGTRRRAHTRHRTP